MNRVVNLAGAFDFRKNNAEIPLIDNDISTVRAVIAR